MEHRVAIKFCFEAGFSAIKTHELMQKTYKNNCVSCATVFEFLRRFQENWKSLEDDPRDGRPRTSLTDEKI